MDLHLICTQCPGAWWAEEFSVLYSGGNSHRCRQLWVKDVGASLGFSSYLGHPLGNSGIDEVRLGKGCYVNKQGTISVSTL